jgi:hypothetical protein
VIASAKTGRQTKREWSASELVKGVPWLKRMNAQGGDILLRPLDAQELLLVDALNADAVNGMHTQGLTPAVTIETSPGRFQAWIKMSDRLLLVGLRETAVAGVSRSISKVAEYGRLAGFTNHHVVPSRKGQPPYVLVHDASGKVSPAARAYLAGVELRLRALQPERQLELGAAKAITVQRGHGPKQ